MEDHIAVLSGEAMARAQAERKNAVASIRESLTFFTTVRRSRLGDYLDVDGGVDVE